MNWFQVQWIYEFINSTKVTLFQVTNSLIVRCTLLIYSEHLRCLTMMLFLEIKGYPQLLILSYYHSFCCSSTIWQALDLIWCYCLELLCSEKHLLCLSPEMDAIHWWLKWSFYTYYKSMFLPFQWLTKTAKTLNTFSEGCTVSSNEHQKKIETKMKLPALSPPKMLLPQTWKWPLDLCDYFALLQMQLCCSLFTSQHLSELHFILNIIPQFSTSEKHW